MRTTTLTRSVTLCFSLTLLLSGCTRSSIMADASLVDASEEPGLDEPVYLRTGRPTPEVCDDYRDPVDPGARTCGCIEDAECTEAANGRCSVDHEVRICTYDACFDDADCPSGEGCACNSGPYHANWCITAMCLTDADCGDFTCGLSRGCGGGSGRTGYPEEFRCHTAEDECHTDADCGSPTRFCRWGGPDEEGLWQEDRWRCNDSCAIGPPSCPS